MSQQKNIFVQLTFFSESLIIKHICHHDDYGKRLYLWWNIVDVDVLKHSPHLYIQLQDRPEGLFDSSNGCLVTLTLLIKTYSMKWERKIFLMYLCKKIWSGNLVSSKYLSDNPQNIWLFHIKNNSCISY